MKIKFMMKHAEQIKYNIHFSEVQILNIKEVIEIKIVHHILIEKTNGN